MSNNVSHEALLKETYFAAGSIGVTIIPVMARTPADLDEAFAKMHEENCEAVLVLADARTNEEIVELANKWRLPAIFQVPDFVYMGGLLSYGADVSELFREAAVFIDKILKGASPRELPVEQATNLLLRINLKTAKALGIEISPTLLARADEVIE
jgi:putative ABC transport system substrate-binding protein